MAYRGPQPPNLRISSSSSTPSRGTSAANPILSIINPLAPHTRPAQRSGFSQLRSATNPNSFDMDDTILPAEDFGLLCLEIDSLYRFCSLHFLFSFVLISLIRWCWQHRQHPLRTRQLAHQNWEASEQRVGQSDRHRRSCEEEETNGRGGDPPARSLLSHSQKPDPPRRHISHPLEVCCDLN